MFSLDYTPIFDQLHSTKIIPVLTISSPSDAVPLAATLAEQGLNAVEITFRTEAAAKAISEIAYSLPQVTLCAGTVLTPEQAELAVRSGAQAVISPGINPETIDWCLSNHVPIIPGCATPSEVEFCMRRGLSLVKLFPAAVLGGTALLNALKGPYPSMKFMPTGGIRPENAAEYLQLSNVWCCGGTWIAPQSLLNDGNFGAIGSLAAEAFAIAHP